MPSPASGIETWIAKADNGWHHGKTSTLQDFTEPTRTTPKNAAIPQRAQDLMQRAAKALMDQLDAMAKAKGEGAGPKELAAAMELQRQAQWRLDFVAAENSMGFHAPQEAARVLAEAADLARQGQISAIEWRKQAQQ